ncbi:DUF262 domain-containing protein [Demequina sp. NBRC 110057]|uniref:DUF262 domain-containing protein n=1 Tax=Demequina sp. NBRC 110057 TaxID=1570346 RepID=UPI0013566C37|nr:DUF262 domain-containing protein [Demequina sp. NBRC 110057]
MLNLEDEIEAGRREIFTDSYSMSLGELSNLYRDGELDVHPEFQRVFRWQDTQKTRLIESILLGIPLPSIFVAQSADGAWDVVDGVQRLSTILQFQGLLTDDEGEPMPPIRLEGTRLLPSLEGKQWESKSPENSLTQAQRLDFKRAKIDLKIVQRQSSPESKFDLFQRLNSYGSQLTPQEVRSCILIGTNRDFYYWMLDLASNKDFLATVALSERLIREQYHLELALRFIVFRRMEANAIRRIGNLGDYLTSEAIRLANDTEFDRDAESTAFAKTFAHLNSTAGDRAFKKWNADKGSFMGAFINTSFEVIGMGLGYHANDYDSLDDIDALELAKEFWTKEDYGKGFATGVRAETRMGKSIPMGRQLFEK